MKLTCYALHNDTPPIIPAPLERVWMNEFYARHPYRCLPLAIGNCYGWQILLTERVKATWNGENALSDLVVETLKPHAAVSNFTHGILTFDVPYVFRTEPNYHLLVTGPSNHFKDGAAPLTAIVESDWCPYTFTMNYQLTHPGTFIWEKDEPFCQIAIIPVGLQESITPELQRIEQNPELKRELDTWTQERVNFLNRQRQGDETALKQIWQRYYFKGEYPDGRKTDTHFNKLRLKQVKDCREKGIDTIYFKG